MPFTQITESKTQKYVLCTFINRSKSIIMDENKRVWKERNNMSDICMLITR